MKTAEMELVLDHMVFTFRGASAILDTGCPATIPAPRIVSDFLSRKIDWVVGTNEIRRRPLVIDWPGRTLTFGGPRPEGGEKVPLGSECGIPVVDIETPNGTTKAFLDTAAPLSYAMPQALTGLRPSGRRRDFHPYLGEFEVDTYQVPVRVGARMISVTVGLAPDGLQQIMGRLGSTAWILGGDFFRDRRIFLDLARSELIDFTASVECPNCGDAGELEMGKGSSTASRARMGRAYGAANRILNEELSAEDRKLLRELAAKDIVVVRGTYDRFEDVLQLAGIPFTLVSAEELATLTLTADQIVIINCPGNLGQDSIASIRTFVEAGGSLVTTDWALTNVIEPAFPGLIEHNRQSTGDEVVGVEVRSADHPFLRGMFREGTDPQWWLEGASYPIRILDRERVRVLLTSTELHARHGEAPVAVAFDVGNGDVLHMISHYYLQRAELRTARHGRKWKEYARELGTEKALEGAPASWDELPLGEVEAAHTSLKFMTNVVLEKQRRKWK